MAPPLLSALRSMDLERSAEDRFLVVLWTSVVVLVVASVIVCASGNSRNCWRAFFSVWVSVYAVLLASYLAVFPSTTRRNFYPTYFETHPSFNSTDAPVAAYPGAFRPKLPHRSNTEEKKQYYALPIDEIRGAKPDFDAVLRSELDHRIEYGHYSDCPDPSLVRPRMGGRNNDIPGILGGVW